MSPSGCTVILPPASAGLGSAHGQAVDADRGQSHTDGDGLSVLAAGANALVELQVIANHADALQDVRPVSDQRGALHRATDLAVFNQIRLAGREDELPVGDVDLAAPEIGRVETALDRAHDVLRRRL